MKMSKAEIIAKIKDRLQYPKTTLELMAELKAGKRERIPEYFIDDALRELDKAMQLLDKLV
ncbi:MAG: hypothetical protein ABSE81_03575 [Candidatus Omnitrophota bacterium]